MQLIDRITVSHGDHPRHIELLVGDLTNIPPEHAVDVLIVSAFPNDYLPTPNSLIGSLQGHGLSVGDLASVKQFDLRETFSCWLSREIVPGIPGLTFKRILCFEPLVRGSAPDLVRGIFQSLAPFTFAEPAVRSIALPVVASGDQGNSISTMLPPLMEAAINWLQIGFPIGTIKLVVRDENNLTEALPIFRAWASNLENLTISHRSGPVTKGKPLQIERENKTAKFDVFVSYSHENEPIAKAFESALVSSGLIVFRDKSAIEVGESWQHKIYEALEKCAFAATLLSPSFLRSKMCIEEFNIAMLRQREQENFVLFPILIRDAELPIYMRLVNYVDCRVDDQAKISAAAVQLVRKLRGV